MISEWGLPSEAINSGFHLDFLLHSEIPAYTSLFRHEKGRNTTRFFIGDSYFNKEGKGNINTYLDRLLYDLENIQNKGYIGMITGNHDMQRLGYLRTPEEIKVAMAFLFTMPGVPFVYYGDEIGMNYIEGIASKEGGYNRTGSRTPMQWNDDKNHGFSNNDNPYLPIDTTPGAPTVEKQVNDKNSILSCVKELINIHKSNEALNAESGFNVLMADYPFVYERIGNDKIICVAINPSGFAKEYELKYELGNILLSQNTQIKNNKIIMDGISFIIAEKKN